jgi:protein-S-isoprenylcysteine O-methyltransferase Ste14
MLFFIIVYWAMMVVQVIIRAPFAISRRSRKITEKRNVAADNIMLVLLTIVSLLLPLIYSLTNWLEFADYSLPLWIGWAGVFLIICSEIVFLFAHIGLKDNWASSLELYEEHTLMKNGIYTYIRHPMYLSQLIWAIAQVLLIQNWIAGLPGIIFFFPFYFHRIRNEEKMMLDRFGTQYEEYEKTTGRLFPKVYTGKNQHRKRRL